jgi:hypothetical protein
MAGNFTAGNNTTTINHLGIPFDLIQDTQVITGDGAITLLSGVVTLTKASAAAITIAVPDQDGQTLWVITETAQAHVITQSTVGFNLKNSSGTITFTAAIGNACLLISRNGNWMVPVKTGVTVA